MARLIGGLRDRLRKTFGAPPLVGLDWIMPSGKFSGFNLSQMMDAKIAYVAWMVEEEAITLTTAAHEKYREMLDIDAERKMEMYGDWLCADMDNAGDR